MVTRPADYRPVLGLLSGLALLAIAGAVWLLAASAAVFFLSYPAKPLPLVKTIVLAVWIAGQVALIRAAFLLALSLSRRSLHAGWIVATIGAAASVTWVALVLLSVVWRG